MVIHSCHSDYSEFDCVLWIGLFVQLAISLGYDPIMDLILIILIIVMSTVSFTGAHFWTNFVTAAVWLAGDQAWRERHFLFKNHLCQKIS